MTNNKDSKVVKLSPKQKEVIRAVRKGAIVGVFGCAGVECYPYSHFSEIIDLGLLKPTKKNKYLYELTELGKTIDIN